MVDYQLVAFEAYSEDICHFTLAPMASPIVYQAGQYIEAKINDKTWLALSIANAPREDNQLHFTLRHNAQNPLAEQLLILLKKQKKLSLKGPLGRCTLKAVPKDTKLLLLAGGTGLTPIQAIMEEAISLKRTDNLKLYWGISHPDDQYLKDIAIPHTVTRSHGNQDLIHEVLAKDYPSLEGIYVIASGPYQMVKRAKALFLQQGLLPECFLSDMD